MKPSRIVVLGFCALLSLPFLIRKEPAPRLIPPPQGLDQSGFTENPASLTNPGDGKSQNIPPQSGSVTGLTPSLAAALEEARYSVEPLSPQSPHNRNAEFFAANPRQQLRTWFGASGIEFASGLKTPEGQTPWFVHLSLQSVSRKLSSASIESRSVRAQGNRVEIHTPSSDLVEWYENTPAGVEQGFTLQHPPEGSGPIRIQLALSPNARLAPHPNGESLQIQSESGEPLLACSQLKAWDANGLPLDAQMSIDTSGLVLQVQDSHAAYPITIDPLFTNIESRLAEEKVVGDEFGTALALDSNTALIGAPGADGAAGPNSGVAYVFVRNGTTWEFQARLQAQDTALDHQLGKSVSLSADTALLGVPGFSAAYVFTRSNNQWTQQAKLRGDDLAVSETASQFGTAVQISGDSALVGAFGTNAAYVFTRSANVWTQQAKLIPPNSLASGDFGLAVAIESDTAVIGSPGATISSLQNRGCLDVFARTGSTWSHQQRLVASTGAALDRLGSAVALSGNTLIGGLDSMDPLEPGASYEFTRSGSVWSQQARIAPATGTAGSRFGSALALDGNTAAIGAPYENAGATYVFVRSDNSWTQQTKITPQNGVSGDCFGSSIALRSGSLVAGSPQAATDAGPESGSAEIHVFQTTSWSFQAKLVAGNTPSFDLAGSAVALSADTALLGVPREDSAAGADSGAAYVFVRSGTRWSRQAKLHASDPTAAALFGSAVALEQDTALIGAPLATVSSNAAAGAAYVFRRSNALWTQESKLTLQNPAASDQFGASVAVQAQTALVGAPFRDATGAVNSGAACIFVYSGSAWNHQATLASPAPAASDNLGYAVALHSDTALVGAPGPLPDTTTPPAPGKALVFSRTGSSWGLQATLQAVEPSSTDDGFGTALALHNDTALVGAPFRATLAGTEAGAAYVFKRTNSSWSQQSRLTPADAASGDRFGSAVALDQSMALVGAPFKTTAGNQNAGVAYVFSATSTGWAQQAQLTSALDSTPADYFGTSVALASDTALVGAPQDDTADLDSGSAYVFRLGELPAILVQPVSRTVLPNNTVTFAVTASGAAPLQYQWRRNGIEIPGAQSPTLSISVPAQAPFTEAEGTYEVLVSNAGGVASSSPAVLKVNALSVLTQVNPTPLDPRPEADGFLLVRIFPPELQGTGWRFVGEPFWRPPGVPVGGLTAGNREIEYRPLPGYLHPLREPVTIQSGVTTSVLDREYFAVEEPATASLTVTLFPASVSQTALWKFQSEPDSAFQLSGTTRSGLSAGLYLVEFSDVTGFSKPRPLTVSIAEGQVKSATAVYYLPDAQVGSRPSPTGFDSVVSGAPENPLRFIGQIRNDAGAGTGFVVKPRVVCTAAHVVWDELQEAPFTGLRWYFQLERGIHEPVPQIPRGSFILSGYSEARKRVGTVPGQSTPESQNNDVAALWFYELSPEDSPQSPLAGRGGSSGYLASDAADNEWLLSTRLKTLVGYPLDGIAPANQGRIHSLPPFNAQFTHASDRVYLTSDLTSSAGNSGGPLCVQYDDGKFYPAAVYLGGSSQTRVRAIDGDVLKLFNDAEKSANAGRNDGDFGQNLTNGSLSAPDSGNLTVNLEPAAARTAGAAWRIGSNEFLASGQSRSFLARGSYHLKFKKIDGFKSPADRIVTVNGQTTVNASYVFVPKPVVSGPATLRVPRGIPFQTQIQASSSPSTYSAQTLSNEPLSQFGLSLDPSTGMLSGTPATETSVQIRLAATNESGEGDGLILNLTIIPPAPVVSGPGSIQTVAGVPFQSQISASHSPTSFSATLSDTAPLSSIGLSLNPISGLLSGTPTTTGIYTLSVTASNEAGSSQTFPVSLSVAIPPPVVSGPSEIGAVLGTPLDRQIIASHSPTHFAATLLNGDPVSNLGLTLDSVTGILSGTPTQNGNFQLRVRAANSTGLSAPFLITLDSLLPPPVITGPTTATAISNSPFSVPVQATNSPSAYSAELVGGASLASAGLSLNPQTGILSGTTTQGPDLQIRIIASNDIGASEPFVVTLRRIPPTPILSLPTPIRTVQNSPLQFQIQASHSPSSYQATLPNAAPISSIGLSLNSATGLLSGSPTATGTFLITLTASNEAGTSAPQILTLSVSQPGRLFTSLLTPNNARGRTEPVIPSEGRAYPVGSPVKITALPAPGSLFAGWSGTTTSGPVSSTNPILTLTASAMMEVQARFVPNPFLQLGGNYVGLGTSPADPAPALEPTSGISITLLETGAFSGKLAIGSRSLPFTGKFSPDGLATVSVSQGRILPPLTLSLSYDTEGSGTISGTVRNSSGILFNLALQRVPWSAKLNPAPLAGNYTILLPTAPDPAPEFPVGIGYATLKIDAAGKATLIGKLGDNTPLSASALLDANEQIPLFTAPAALAGGSVSGLWSFPSLNQTTASLTFTAPARPRAAYYPVAFSGTLDAVGNRFLPAPTGTPALSPVTLDAEFLTPAALTLSDPGAVTLDASSKLVLPASNPNLLQAFLNPKTGAFTGSFRLDGKTVPFTGVYLKEDRCAAALFLLPSSKASGSLLLNPASE
jgi:hypothetical protein